MRELGKSVGIRRLRSVGVAALAAGVPGRLVVRADAAAGLVRVGNTGAPLTVDGVRGHPHPLHVASAPGGHTHPGTESMTRTPTDMPATCPSST